MSAELDSFETGVIRPVECLRAGWESVRERYWLLVGVCFVAMLMNSVPLVLLGPAMCGLSIIFFNLQRREPVVFDQLFRGFDLFLPSLIVSLVVFAIQMVLLVPLVGAFMVMVFTVIIGGHKAGPPSGEFLGLLIGGYVVFLLGLMVITALTYLFTFFAYPLLVERRLQPMAALRLSFRAARANVWGLLGLYLLNLLVGVAGLCCCYVGIFLVTPVVFGAIFAAYRRIFPPLGPQPPPLPPEPAA